MKHFGMRLKELRLKFGYTQERLTENVDFNRNNYVNIEKGNRSAPNSLLRKLAVLYAIPFKQLEDERNAWLMVRKYSVEAIRLACRYLDETSSS